MDAQAKGLARVRLRKQWRVAPSLIPSASALS
jgi:hypothetical protein